ncbi:MAG: Uma2 family endonuclease [Anaerolineales bacterium]
MSSATETPVVLPAPTPGLRLKMSYEDFLAWAGEDVHAEWVDGEVLVHMTATTIHQRVAIFLASLLKAFVEALELGEIFTGPMQVKLSPTGSGREPDVFFLTVAKQAQLREKYFAGAPDLIIEVVSDESVSRDRIDKFEEYENAGVREYWIVDPRPRRRRADFFQLGTDGKYQPVPTPEGVYRSMVLPGFWLRVEWLWQEPLPKLLPTLETIQKGEA